METCEGGKAALASCTDTMEVWKLCALQLSFSSLSIYLSLVLKYQWFIQSSLMHCHFSCLSFRCSSVQQQCQWTCSTKDHQLRGNNDPHAQFKLISLPSQPHHNNHYVLSLRNSPCSCMFLLATITSTFPCQLNPTSHLPNPSTPTHR